MRIKTFRPENRQRGIALVLAIGFLAILSIIGAVVMQVSTRDLSESSVVLPSQEALYAADRAVEYALNRDIIINLGQNGEPNSEDLDATTVNAKVREANGSVKNIYHVDVINAGGVGSIISGQVTDEGPRTLPPHLAEKHGSEFGANLYHVTVEATSDNDLSNGIGPYEKTTHVDASIVRLYKKDDDQIFRTSGGG